MSRVRIASPALKTNSVSDIFLCRLKKFLLWHYFVKTSICNRFYVVNLKALKELIFSRKINPSRKLVFSSGQKLQFIGIIRR